MRCLPRHAGDTPAVAPVASPAPATGALANGWAPLAGASSDSQTFGPLRDEGQQGFFELEIWSTAGGNLVIDAGGQ